MPVDHPMTGMHDRTVPLGRFDTLVQDRKESALAARREAKEIAWLLEELIALRPVLAEPGERLVQAIDQDLRGGLDAYGTECRLDRFSRDVRALWLRSVAAETACVLRSPTEQEAERLSRRHDSYGYERDLQPRELERRCDAFFGAVPRPWRSEHIVFSSGQAALLGVLMSFKSERPLRIQHLGSYFETCQLIRSCPSLCLPVESGADVVIAEPVACDGGFDYHGPGEIAAAVAQARALVLDTTLLGRNDNISDLLGNLDDALLVIRCASGLKLLQAGLELANVGIVGVHAQSRDALVDCAASLREMRTLCGTGLRLADVLALEAPFVFDASYADRYATAVLAHNAALARGVASRNRLFAAPSSAVPAPYCAFSIRGHDDGAYDRLESLIARMAKERRLLFEQGGSFGFRGHRYEVVRPEDAPPFLRVAMGRRGGWSCDGVIRLMAEIASAETV